MGTGKTAVGRRLAEDLGAAFVDVDETIEKRAGRSVRAIFDEEGERGFRRRESEAIAELASGDRTVISTGGGALLNLENRERLSSHGILVCLRARTATLLERLKDDLTRPLLAGENVEERVERLMRDRQAVYDACPVQIDTDHKTIAEVAADIRKAVEATWR